MKSTQPPLIPKCSLEACEAQVPPPQHLEKMAAAVVAGKTGTVNITEEQEEAEPGPTERMGQVGIQEVAEAALVTSAAVSFSFMSAGISSLTGPSIAPEKTAAMAAVLP